MQSVIRNIARVMLPLLAIVLAVMVARKLVASKPEAPRKPAVEAALPVEILIVERIPARLDVEAQGSVIAAQQVALQPQVAGRVIAISPALVQGGVVNKGDMLVRLEATDYQLALAQAKATLEEAKARLEIERGQQVIAKKEWELFSTSDKTEAQDAALALRGPQLKIAQLAIDTADARVKQAQLDLSRTTVRAPFNAIIQGEDVELGQLLGTQSRVATLTGTDTAWVKVAIPLEALDRITLPAPGADAESGSVVTITQRFGGQTHERQGRALRLLGELDPVGRMAQVLVEVRDPMNLNDASRGQMPLLLGAYVRVHLAGGTEEDLIEIPRAALREEGLVYVAAPGDVLAMREVEVAWRRPTTVLIRSGLEPGDKVIISRVGAPIAGTKLRIAAPRVARAVTQPLEAPDAQ